jgi:superfamily I DNA/RNA helicase
MLREHTDIRSDAEQLYSHIHVDEYQDTNALQGDLANMLARALHYLFAGLCPETQNRPHGAPVFYNWNQMSEHFFG